MTNVIVYFQGFGLPFSYDYCGSFMVRDEDHNGIYQSVDGFEVREGSQCDSEEFVRFINS